MNSTCRSQPHESDSDLPGSGRLACDRCRGRDASEIEQSQAGSDVRGLLWVAGAFVFCPCHLPLTLWLLAAVLAGTTTGALVQGHPFVAGTLTTLVWLVGTWHGMRLMRRT
jgi:energy-converting hydrogenase Eha subunit G